MGKLVSLLTLLKWVYDTIMAAYQLFKIKKAEKAEEKHDEAIQKLKDAEDEEAQKQATRDLARDP